MLDNTLSISVDVANDGNPSTIDMTRHTENGDKSTYILSGHSLSSRDVMDVIRTFPQPAGNFRGLAKSFVRFTKDVTVLGKDGSNLVTPLIASVEFRMPVGVSDSDVLEFRQRIIGLLDNDTIMDKAHKSLEI